MTARDFTVQVGNIPPQKDLRDLKAKLWLWGESVLRKEKNRIDPKRGAFDRN